MKTLITKLTVIVILTLCANVTTNAQSEYLYNEETHYEQAKSLFDQMKIALCVEECKGLIKNNGRLVEDAQVLLALCRETQGFDRAAIHLYKKLEKKESATGIFHYGVMMSKKGHLKEAEALFQKCISLDRTMTEAHLYLSNIMLTQGYRFEAMMPLYYTLLISTDKNQQSMAYEQLLRLWRRSAQALDLLHNNKNTTRAFNRSIDQYISTLTTSDSILVLNGKEQIELLNSYTSKLFNHLLETSEENLDFYQIYYTDFFVTLSPRNFVTPYVYYISDVKHHAAVLEWINANGYLFNEFRLWMEAQ